MASCKDCIYDKVCSEYFHAFWGCTANKHSDLINAEPKDCPYFKDRSRFVELPCKVGNSVFTIDEKENIQECIVTNVNCKTQMTFDEKPWIDFIIVTEPVDDSLPFPMIFTYSITKNKILFLTKESAEQAIKERENND